MQTLIIAGTVGKDAVLRNTNSGETVLGFSLAVDNGKDKNGEKRDATWYDCAIWGDRAKKLEDHIKKGLRLTLTGRPTAREHEGKVYLGIAVNDLTFQGGGAERGGGGGYSEGFSGPAGRASEKPAYDLSDDIPFITCNSIR